LISTIGCKKIPFICLIDSPAGVDSIRQKVRGDDKNENHIENGFIDICSAGNPHVLYQRSPIETTD
jgi:hypothetical protein